MKRNPGQKSSRAARPSSTKMDTETSTLRPRPGSSACTGPMRSQNSSANAEEEEANAGGDEDFFNLSNPSGNPEHEAMVERARRRRAQKMEERKREEAELEQQAEERARRKEAARDRKWKKHKEKRLRQLEGRDKGVMEKTRPTLQK